MLEKKTADGAMSWDKDGERQSGGRRYMKKKMGRSKEMKGTCEKL